MKSEIVIRLVRDQDNTFISDEGALINLGQLR